MSKKYTAKVNDVIQVDFTSVDLNDIDVRMLSKNRYHLLKNHQSHIAEVVKSDFLRKSYTVKINSNTYTVTLENELDLLIEEMGLSIGQAQVINDIKAPMPGLILEINVSEGQEVKEGDYLLVLEAMKMENAITAPRDAVIKSISVEKGETVEKNQLLIEME